MLLLLLQKWNRGRRGDLQCDILWQGKNASKIHALLFTSPAILLPQIYLVNDRISYGSMQGFGENCTPRGQCTFGARLLEEEIKVLAKFVKLQADQGWPNIESSEDCWNQRCN